MSKSNDKVRFQGNVVVVGHLPMSPCMCNELNVIFCLVREYGGKFINIKITFIGVLHIPGVTMN